jgi:two-component system, OmpR family, sensor histidine kinase KdpD
LETGAIQVDRDWASIGEIAGSVINRLGERLAAHRLIVDLPATLPLVRIDAALIEQALGNLLENAARHTPAGTVVRLHAHTRGAELLVSVEDFGGGPVDSDLERIFRKFHHGTIEGAVGGVGLGLAICRAIVRLHVGNVWAERMPAGGMAFRFTLPLEEVPGVPDETAADGYDRIAPDHPRR